MTTRQDTKRNNPTKPYARKINNEVPASPKVESPDSSSHILPTLDVHANPGFPTCEQYKRLESAYLASLHPRKRDKALINQAMFDRIWDTFMQPGSRHESPQFRFWVRKMFTLSEPPTFLSSSGLPTEAIRPVLLHDKRPVAIQEQIYDIICYCHARAEHGGRDKTRAIVREHYSWVPKELVSQFVKACPTCTLKKCGNTELAAIMGQQMVQTNPILKQEQEQAILPLRQSSDVDVKARPWTPSGGPVEFLKRSFSESSGNPSDSTASTASSRRPSPSLVGVESTQVPHTFYFPEAPTMSREPQSLPMSREVSLYHGLPNGWQYHSKYPEALEVHKKRRVRKRDGSTAGAREPRRVRRPRIPSVLPLGVSDQRPTSEEHKENEKDNGPDRLVTLPSLKEALSEGLPKDHNITMMQIPRIPHSSLPESLQRFQVFFPVQTQVEEAPQVPYVPQIDPVLLQEGNNVAFTGETRESERLHHWEQQQQVLSAPHAIILHEIPRKGEKYHENQKLKSHVSTGVQKGLTKPQTLRHLSAANVGNNASPLRSFQTFQHLLDWKNNSTSHPRDDSPLSPFSPRGSFVPTRSASTGSCFSVFNPGAASSEEPLSSTSAIMQGKAKDSVHIAYSLRMPEFGHV